MGIKQCLKWWLKTELGNEIKNLHGIKALLEKEQNFYTVKNSGMSVNSFVSGQHLVET